MKTTLTSALAFLLLAGASSAALAQEHDHSGGDRPSHQDGAPQGGSGGGQGHQGGGQQWHGGQPAGAPKASAGAPGGAAAPAPGGAPAYQNRNARFGAPPPSGGPAAQADRSVGNGAPRGRDGSGGHGDRFAHENEQGARGDRAGGYRTGDRNFSGAPHEVIPPQASERAGERGWDRQHDGHLASTNPNWRPDGRGDNNRGAHGNNNYGGQSHWNHGDHWERGRVPPVFWAQNRYHLGAYRAPYGYYVRDWGYGDFLPRGWFGVSYFIGDFLDYDLPYPPPGFEWVRVGGDALLVDRYTGRIVQVVRGIFW